MTDRHSVFPSLSTSRRLLNDQDAYGLLTPPSTLPPPPQPKAQIKIQLLQRELMGEGSRKKKYKVLRQNAPFSKVPKPSNPPSRGGN